MVQKSIGVLLLIVLLPIFLIIFLLHKLLMSGEFIFKQKRVGKDKKIFEIYKMRTMVPSAEKMKKAYVYLNEADGPIFKIRDDPRFTQFGKFLSHTALDELPQIVNIIKGEMAFVGPRPLPIEEAEKIPLKYQGRFTVLPGITSLWIIKGAHTLSFKEWMQLDMQYVKQKSVLLDISICLHTLLLLMKMSINYLKKIIT